MIKNPADFYHFLPGMTGVGASESDELPDPENTAITLESLERLAHAVGKRLRIEIA